ncbi:MAG: formylmethanofuran dehydrogenase subunit E family protein [Myxococcales bacterium]|nr:formylmethanofuran dehydrogenase subunit E family protein [Myxococcales bacterium]
MHHASALDPAHASPDEATRAVTAVHGGAGPFAMAGWRMGAHALTALGLSRGSGDVDVVHISPPSVQWSCIADGVAAATGASVGRLNLRRVDSADGTTRTELRNRATGRALVYRLAPGFAARFADGPDGDLGAAGRAVLTLDDAEVFQSHTP